LFLDLFLSSQVNFSFSILGVAKTYFEEDLFPGEIFGETALAGNHTRNITALAVTACDLLIIDDQDFVMAQDRDSVHMGTEERSKFLTQVSMFRNWDSYKLLRLAHVLIQEEVDKGTTLITHGTVSKDFYFIINGKVEVLDSLEKRNVITTLTTNDFFGESGFCNKFTKSLNHKVVEEFYAVASTKVDVLVFHEANFNLFDIHSIDLVKQAFKAKQQWRRDRVNKMKHERALMRMQYHIMHLEADRMMVPGGTAILPQSLTIQTTALPTTAAKTNSHTPHPNSTRIPLFPIEVSETTNNQGLLQNIPHARIVHDSRPSSPTGERPPLSSGPQTRPVAAVRSNVVLPAFTALSLFPTDEPEIKEGIAELVPVISATDMAYRQALVHPLDERYSDDAYWHNAISANEKKKSALDNIHEIPALLAKDFSMIMVAASLKHPREFDKIQDLVLTGKKSVSPRRQQLQLQVSLSRRGMIANPRSSDTNADTHRTFDDKPPQMPAFLANLSRPGSATQRRPWSATAASRSRSGNQTTEDSPQMFIRGLDGLAPLVDPTEKPQRPLSANATTSRRGLNNPIPQVAWNAAEAHEPAVVKGITSSNPVLQQMFHHKINVPPPRPQSASALRTLASSAAMVEPSRSVALNSMVSAYSVESIQQNQKISRPTNAETPRSTVESLQQTAGRMKKKRSAGKKIGGPTVFTDEVVDDVTDEEKMLQEKIKNDRPPLMPSHPGAKRGVLQRY
jgi:CRP-like cAMP-binding protein